MKRAIVILVFVLLLFGCEHYAVNTELNSIFSTNDLDVVFKVLEDDDHKCTITTQNAADGNVEYITIVVENELSITSGEAHFTPVKEYHLSITMKNESSDPLILYSFWTDNITESRYYVLAGDDVEFPTSETQSIHNEWKTFEELLETKENEKFMKIWIRSNAGSFRIKNISIEEI